MTAQLENDKQDLFKEMDDLHRSLRKCDTQALAVQWMTRAYNAMDAALRVIEAMDKEKRLEASDGKGLIFQIKRPELEIVQSIPTNIAHRVSSDRKATYQRQGQTVVYPDFFLHPGLRPEPKAWTHKDTLKLEAAQKMGPRRIIRKGR